MIFFLQSYWLLTNVLNRVATALEIREIMEESRKMKKIPSDQGKVSEFEKERGKSLKSQGIFTVCPNVEVTTRVRGFSALHPLYAQTLVPDGGHIRGFTV